MLRGKFKLVYICSCLLDTSCCYSKNIIDIQNAIISPTHTNKLMNVEQKMGVSYDARAYQITE